MLVEPHAEEVVHLSLELVGPRPQTADGPHVRALGIERDLDHHSGAVGLPREAVDHLERCPGSAIHGGEKRQVCKTALVTERGERANQILGVRPGALDPARTQRIGL